MSNRLLLRKVTILLKVAKLCGNVESSGTLDSLEKHVVESDEREEDSVIMRRREEVVQNEDLSNINEMFWNTLNPWVDPKTMVLSKEGYLKFNIAAQLALTGDSGDESLKSAALADYMSDTKQFGIMTKVSFFDIINELVDLWTEMINSSSKAAFAWNLLVSTTKIAKMPPRFRNSNDVKQFTSMTGVEMLNKYSADSKLRKQIKTILEWMSEKLIDVKTHARLGNRRTSSEINRDLADVIRLANRHIIKGTKLTEDSEDSSSVQSFDEESMSSSIESMKKKKRQRLRMGNKMTQENLNMIKSGISTLLAERMGSDVISSNKNVKSFESVFDQCRDWLIKHGKIPGDPSAGSMPQISFGTRITENKAAANSLEVDSKYLDRNSFENSSLSRSFITDKIPFYERSTLSREPTKIESKLLSIDSCYLDLSDVFSSPCIPEIDSARWIHRGRHGPTRPISRGLGIGGTRSNIQHILRNIQQRKPPRIIQSKLGVDAEKSFLCATNIESELSTVVISDGFVKKKKYLNEHIKPERSVVLRHRQPDTLFEASNRLSTLKKSHNPSQITSLDNMNFMSISKNRPVSAISYRELPIKNRHRHTASKEDNS